MNFTAAYSELESLVDYGPRRGVTFAVYDGLKAVHESIGIAEDTYRDLLVLDEWTTIPSARRRCVLNIPVRKHGMAGY